MIFDGFIGESYTSRALNFDAQRSMNLYLEADESGKGKSNIALLGTPGLTLAQTLPTSPIRGIWTGLLDHLPGSTGPDLAVAAAGSKIYQVTLTAGIWAYTLLGDIGDDAAHSPVTFQVNGTQILISSGGNLYCMTGELGVGPYVVTRVFFNEGTGTVDTVGTAVTWDSGDVFDASMVGQYILITGVAYQITAFTDELTITIGTSAGNQTGATFYVLTGSGATPIFVAAAQTAYLDTYGAALPPDSHVYFISAINDFLNWNPLDFAAKAAFPDNIAAILADHEELWLLGTEASEAWQNNGGSAVSSFPFQRNPGAIVSQGCRAPFTLCSVNNGIFWIGGTPQGGPIAWFLQGFSPIRVSTHAIEAAWGDYTLISDAIAFVYVQDGHQFVVISFPTANATWCWDATAGTWHERGWWNGATIDRHRAAYHGYFSGVHLVGDWQNGNLYVMAPGVYTDNGVQIVRIRTAPHLSDEELWTFYSRFRLMMLGGPSPTLAWSDDLGLTYNTPVAGSVRRISSTSDSATQISEWRRLGRARDRVFSVTITDALQIALTGAALNLGQGDG